VQRLLTSGPRGWSAGQTPWLTGPTLEPLMGWPRGDTLQGVVEWNPKLKVGGRQTPWPTNHVVCYLLNQVSNPTLDPYK
jgi:hypothetical protein